MARSGSKSRPGRSLLGLFVVLAIVFGWIAIGSMGSGSSKAQWTPKLGIDLEGGVELILSPVATVGGAAKPNAAQIAEAVNIIRQRVNGSGISEAQVSTQGADKIIVRLPGKSPDKKTIDLVKQSAELSFRPVLVEGATAQVTTTTTTPTPTASGTTAPSSSEPAATASSTPEAKPATTPKANKAIVPQALIRRAAATTPAAAATTAPADSATTPVTSGGSAAAATPDAASTPTPAATAEPVLTPAQVAEVCKQANAAKETIDASAETNKVAKGTGSDLSQVDKKTTSVFCPAADKVSISTQFQLATCSRAQLNALKSFVSDPKLPLVTCSTDGTSKLILGPVEVRGAEIKSASSGLATNQQGFSTGEWEVKLNFKSQGTSQFAKVTERLATLTGSQNQFAIVLDGLVVSNPGVRSSIPSGEASITGSFTQDSSATLASQLKFGALPLSFSVDSQNEISALLGASQLQHGLLAGVIGLVLVLLYSLAQYRALGLVTAFSLVLAGTTTYGLVLILSWQNGYRLSLAGVAGLIVSIGITADSFIVYFERVRDEVREGRPLRTAVEAGWGRARRTILISDTVNFLAAVVLYILAIGDVRGFAFTLGLTTLVDVMIVFLFTKPTVTLLSRTSFFDGGHSWSGFSAEQLGRSVSTYAGRGRIRPPSGPSIAERRAAAEAAESGGSAETDDDDADSGSMASSRRNS